jgi:hypothetical protein
VLCDEAGKLGLHDVTIDLAACQEAEPHRARCTYPGAHECAVFEHVGNLARMGFVVGDAGPVSKPGSQCRQALERKCSPESRANRRIELRGILVRCKQQKRPGVARGEPAPPRRLPPSPLLHGAPLDQPPAADLHSRQLPLGHHGPHAGSAQRQAEPELKRLDARLGEKPDVRTVRSRSSMASASCDVCSQVGGMN